MDKIIRIGLSLLFLICLADMPYGYFQFVRFIGMVGFAVLAYNANAQNNNNFFVIWLVSAILINPIVKISLGRVVWNVVDVIWVIILLGSLFVEKKQKK